jgi:hypothetical protein
MSRIPQDVERLMWIVAESNDLGAIADFESRFPDLAPELARRRMMVAKLRDAKSPHVADSRIPQFTPRSTQPSGLSKGTWIASGLALAALAVASYSVTVWISKPPPTLPKVEPVQVTGPANPDTNLYEPPKLQPDYTPPRQDPPPTAANPPPTDRQEQPKTLKLSNTSLEAALKMIGEMAGYEIQVAPGFKDQQVSIDYVDSTTTEMLKDLGVRYNFTPFDQGDGTIIIVPATDGNEAADGADGSRRRIG